MYTRDDVFQMKFGRSFPKSEELALLPARKLFSFADKTDGLNFVRLDVGPADDPLVWLDNVDRSPSDDSDKKFQALISSGKARSKIIHYRDGKIIEVEVARTLDSEPFLQPMPDNLYLLALGWAGTAWIVDAGGALVKQFHLGAKIEAMQATANGNIWTGYYDEGAYGKDPISCNLIACFNKEGTLLFPDHYIDEFSDWCVGLNVASENCIWFFPNNGTLVQIDNFYISRIGKSYCVGSGIFAVSDDFACWAPMCFPPWSLSTSAGGAPPFSVWLGIDFFLISNLDSGDVGFYRAVDERGNLLYPDSYAARGSKMYFTIKYDVYIFDLKNILV